VAGSDWSLNISDNNHVYTSFELNRLLRQGYTVRARVATFEGEHTVLATRMAAHDRLQAQVTVKGETVWRNVMPNSIRVEEREVKCA
jgi:hypothetical protein